MAKPNFTLPNKPAIKSGSILSYNYTDDFTFVPTPLTFNRDSAATRVNEKGLIEDVGYFGPELVQNGDFSEIGPELVTNGDFSNWTNDNPDGWTITGTENQNNYITEYQGKARYVSDGSTLFISQDILTTGKFYKVTADIVVNSGGGMRFQLGANGAQHVFTTTQSIVLYAQQDGTNGDLQIIRQGATDFTIDNVSVKEVGQNWSFGTGWSVGDGKAVKTSGTGSSLVQTVPVTTIGKKYKFSFDAIVTNGVINATIYGVTIPSFTASGSQEHTITATSTSGFYFYGNNFFEGSIDNVSIIEVLGDKPRIDYSDSLTEPSLLLEPQSTNLITYSEDLTQSFNEVDVTSTQNYGVAPNGNNESTRLQLTSSTSHYWSNYTLTNGEQYTVSFYYKGVKGETTYIRAIAIGGGTGNQRLITFNGSWQREELTFTAGSTTNYVYIADNRVGSAETANDFEVWGAQLEQLSYATSYIPTAGSTATRLGETANNAGDVNVFNSEEGVLYAEIAALGNQGTAREITINDGTTNNRVIISYNVYNQIRINYRNSSSNIFDQLINSTITDFHKIAVKWKVNDFSFYLDGNEIASSSSGSVIPANTLTTLSFDDGNSSYNFEGKVRNVKVFNKALTDRELEILTIQ
jgi:hypothetical protein